MKASVALNPATPVSVLSEVIADLDMVCIMSVNPGYSGQKFIINAVNKVREVKELILKKGSKALIEVDGGINETTGKLVVDAGADVLVAGNYVFGAADPRQAISTLYNLK